MKKKKESRSPRKNTFSLSRDENINDFSEKDQINSTINKMDLFELSNCDLENDSYI